MSNKKGIVAVIGAAATAVSTAKPIVDAVTPVVGKTVGVVNEKIEERKRLVTVPEVGDSKFPLSLEQATELINKNGLEVMSIAISVTDADKKYRNYINNQVVETKPKSGQKVEPGSSVLVKYITQEVIDESKHIYEESENQKAQKIQERLEKKAQKAQKAKERSEQKAQKAQEQLEKKIQKAQRAQEQLAQKTQENPEQEKNKQKINDIFGTAKKKVKAISSHLHKQKDVEITMDETEDNSST
ncbi:MAG: PASTA domain-containing protein [Clostridiales bacterium]|nr:PASTA domain-containing protein [Clostridiales bacterium]